MSAPPANQLLPGDTVPWFTATALDGSPTYTFHTAAGRPMLLLFFGSAANKGVSGAMVELQARRSLFDDVNACFFGVTCDPVDVAAKRIAQQIPGIRFFLDYDRAVSLQFGAVDAEGNRYFPHCLLLDRTLRVVAHFPLEEAAAAVAALAAEAASPRTADWAPVIQVSDVFEPAICRRLVSLYGQSGGEESGFMREVDGRTVLRLDPAHKQRRDYVIDDKALQHQLMGRVRRRLAPMLKRAFQFEATRIERHIVACYAAGAGHFRAHRDNTTSGTAHRRFAVTINLNEGYEGGDLRFPEFGPRTYRAPRGGAVVFSCSLLHEATPVTRGTRYAYLPFLYDEDAARQREANNPYLSKEVAAYRRSLPRS